MGRSARSSRERPRRETGLGYFCCGGHHGAAGRRQVQTSHGSRGVVSLPGVSKLLCHVSDSWLLCPECEPGKVGGHMVTFKLNYSSQAQVDCSQLLNLVQ